MNHKEAKHELQNIISRKNGTRNDSLIQTVANHIGSGKRTSPMAPEKHENKTQEAKKIIRFAEQNELLFKEIDQSKYISSGAEQKVYIKDNKHVIKLNDAIYYASWEDYLHNLLLHNYFFTDTAYELLGFHINDQSLYAVVEQPFVKADSLTNLEDVKQFLNANGFNNNRNHDYYHPTLGIILEDLHDENVLTQQKMLYFIDTVFYIDPKVFWE